MIDAQPEEPKEEVPTHPMAILVEGTISEDAPNAFPIVLEDIKQALAKHDGTGGIEVKLVHLYLDQPARDIAVEAALLHKDGD